MHQPSGGGIGKIGARLWTINRRREGRAGEENRRLVSFLPSPSKNLRRREESTRAVDRKKRQKSRRHTSLTHKICFVRAVRGGSRLRHRRRKAFSPPIFRPNEPGRSGGVESYACSKDIGSRHECRSRKKDRQIGESGLKINPLRRGKGEAMILDQSNILSRRSESVNAC